MKKTDRPPLTIVGPPGATSLQPSRPLGTHGQALWNKVTAEYAIEDAAGIELLTQACQGCDRAEELAECIRLEGATVRGPTGTRVHPAIREEMACRAFCVRTLQKLGLNWEPLRSAPGRPSGRF